MMVSDLLWKILQSSIILIRFFFNNSYNKKHNEADPPCEINIRIQNIESVLSTIIQTYFRYMTIPFYGIPSVDPCEMILLWHEELTWFKILFSPLWYSLDLIINSVDFSTSIKSYQVSSQQGIIAHVHSVYRASLDTFIKVCQLSIKSEATGH